MADRIRVELTSQGPAFRVIRRFCAAPGADAGNRHNAASISLNA
jgi:hypothetical protein